MITVAHEDRDLLIVIKPAGLPTTAPAGGDSLTRRLERERPSLHPTSRLDAEVTGLVTYAKTKRAIAVLREARSEGRYHRGYLALAGKTPAPPEGVWDASIAIDPRDPTRRVALDPASARGKRVQRARTSYRVREERRGVAVLWLTPHTGRTHQLRVHAAHAGAPLLGDVRYGGERRVVLEDGRVIAARRVMLHCAWLCLPDVAGGPPLEIRAEAPADLVNVWIALGGSERALDVRR